MEFLCEYCSKPLMVPDGSSGRRCKCPNCGESLTVPDDNVAEILEEVSDSDDLLSIPCPKCHHLLRCKSDLLNTKGLCRVCRHTFLITEDVDLRAQSVEAPKLVFNCPKCDQLFEGREEMRGKRGKCHNCGDVFSIVLKEAASDVSAQASARQSSQTKSAGTKVSAPLPSSQKLSTTSPAPKASAPKPAIQKPVPQTSKSSAPIRLNCPGCRGTMEVPGSSMGLSTSCPYCQEVFEIHPNVVAREPVSPAPAPQSPQVSPDPFGYSAPSASGPDQWGNLNVGIPAPTMNPYAASFQAPAPRRRSGTSSGKSDGVYIAPGICLLIFGFLAFGMWGYQMFINVVMADHAEAAMMDEMERSGYWVGYYGAVILMGVFGFVSSALMIAGGIAGIMRRGVGWARAGAIGAFLPCQCCFLSLPIGIWACIIYFSSDAARDFK
ncbi:MAG: hypothetical protein U0892_03390 [Pirellulales bacterium]